MQAVLDAKARGDERPVARLRIALDAQERSRRLGREPGHQCPEIDSVEDLTDVALGVLGRQHDAVALGDTVAFVDAVLELT